MTTSWRDVVDEPTASTSVVVTTPATKDTLAVEAQSWASRARTLTIIDRESCLNASQLLRSIKGLRSQIQLWFSPFVESAMEMKRKAEAARKALTDELARMEAPLVEAETVLKRNLLAFEAAQERARLAQEQALQAEAQRQADAVTLAAAAALELEATRTGDAEMLQEAHDILAQPSEAPVVSVARAVPTVQGITYRDAWKAHPDIDVRQLARAVADGAAPTAFLTPNLTAINQFARATQGAQPLAGVKFFNDRTIAARG